MRVIILSGVLTLLVAPPLAAQTVGSGRGAGASATAPFRRQPGVSRAQRRPALDNGKALEESNARQKRWDERMRRATRSMCDRC